jgi:hypothetical protein
MKIIFLFSTLVLLGIAANSQYLQTKIQISPTEYNFGVFKEEAGRQSFDFIVTNAGNAPLIIQNVVASCGCTTPEWTKGPIPPGGRGKVTAIYDPANRPGSFNKTLTVYTNAKPGTSIITIKGEVTPREKTVDEIYTFPVGPVRFESNQLAFSDLKKTEKRTRAMPVINKSNTPVKIEFDGLPGHLTIKSIPETLMPGKKGVVEATYDGSGNQGWGYVNDIVRIKTNGVVQEKVFLYVSAKLVEDFSKLTSEELANAPVIKLLSYTVEIGKMLPATSKEVEFRFTNEGKSNLIIRNVKATCGCTAIQQEKTQGAGIVPGESSNIKATFNSGGYKGKVSKTIYVYTNDPKKSEVVLTLNAEVEQAPGENRNSGK